LSLPGHSRNKSGMQGKEIRPGVSDRSRLLTGRFSPERGRTGSLLSCSGGRQVNWERKVIMKKKRETGTRGGIIKGTRKSSGGGNVIRQRSGKRKRQLGKEDLATRSNANKRGKPKKLTVIENDDALEKTRRAPSPATSRSGHLVARR